MCLAFKVSKTSLAKYHMQLEVKKKEDLVLPDNDLVLEGWCTPHGNNSVYAVDEGEFHIEDLKKLLLYEKRMITYV